MVSVEYFYLLKTISLVLIFNYFHFSDDKDLDNSYIKYHGLRK